MQYLYKITESASGKSYIGVSNDPYRRFNYYHAAGCGNKHLSKFNKDSLSLEVLVAGSASYIYTLEQMAILTYNTKYPFGFNISSGGEVGIPSKGEDNGRALLTPKLVQEIRELYAMGYSQVDLSKFFEVSRATVGYIVRGETWPDAPGPITLRGKGRGARNYK